MVKINQLFASFDKIKLKLFCFKTTKNFYENNKCFKNHSEICKNFKMNNQYAVKDKISCKCIRIIFRYFANNQNCSVIFKNLIF